MKNKIFILAFSMILILPFCSSAAIDMKSSYNLGETFLAKISGNFLQPLSGQSVSFYRRHMPTTMDVSLTKISDVYYIYGQISPSKIPDNYSLVISRVKYLQGGRVKDDNLFYNFSITNETADFSIEPAALATSSDFSIILQNLKDETMSVSVSFSNESDSLGGFLSFFTATEENSEKTLSFSLSPEETKSVNFDLDDLVAGENTIKFKSENLEYLLPVMVLKEKENQKFNFEESDINLSLEVNSSKSEKVMLFNYGKDSIENISLSLSNSLKPYINLSTDLIDELEKNSSTGITLTILLNKTIRVEGYLKAEHEEETRTLPIYLDSGKNISVIANYTDNTSSNTPISNNSEEELPKISQTCAEAGGTPCGGDMSCEGKYVDAKDDKCCIGNCYKPSSSNKKILGWSILILSILILIGFLALKYIRTKNRINLHKVLVKR